MHTLKTVVQALTCVVALAGLTACDQAKDPGEKAKTGEKARSGDTPKAAKDKAKGAAKSNTAPAKTPGANEGPVVTLIEAGQNPKLLRLKLEKGNKVTAEMLMKMSMNMEINGMKPPAMKLPATRMLMDMEITDVSADTYNYAFVVTEAVPVKEDGVQQMIMDAMAKALKNTVGLKGKGTMDNRGVNKGASFELPPTLDPQTRQLMDGMRDAVGRMSAPLPKEPVGVGGKWTVTQQLTQNGMTLDQKATYTVKSIDGDLINFDVAVEMNAKPQAVKAPGLPPGAKMQLESMTGKGGGTTQQPLTSMLPKLSNVKIDTAMKSTVEAGGQTQKMAMDMSMEVTIQPKK